MDVVNISKPPLDHRTGHFDTPGDAQRLILAGDLLYVASHTSGLQAVDITDPSRPQPIGGLAMLSESNRVLAQEALVYVASDLRLNVAPLDCLSLTAVPEDAPPASTSSTGTAATRPASRRPAASTCCASGLARRARAARSGCGAERSR